MSTANPLEQLRRRMQSQATPTAFVALAEEHRRAGRFGEAIAVCRDGLEQYPAYVSARVTLGRALLDSGDVETAVAELEHAVAQAPDNLAAARALEAAHDALGEGPLAAQPAPPGPCDDLSLPDLPLREADEAAPSLTGALVGQALGVGADGPQEFGLGPDWSVPDAPAPVEPDTDAIASAPRVEDATDTLALFAHSESPTMCLAPPHPQGDEPAGNWPVPAGPSGDAPVAADDGARVYSWALDAPAAAAIPVVGAHAVVEDAGPVSVWDDLTIEAPLADVLDAAAWPAVDDHPAPGLDPLQTFGTESRVEEAPAVVAAADAPTAFAGWGDDAVFATAGADRSPWSDDQSAEQAAAWTVPDGPSATWALGDLHEASGADVTPFQGTLDEAEAVATPFASVGGAVAEPLTPAGNVAWAGSVKSALGEVFALAGHGESLEPPAHASPTVREAMADVAVEATLEDPTLRLNDLPPSLASLQQMLVAVRARRAALFSNVEP